MHEPATSPSAAPELRRAHTMLALLALWHLVFWVLGPMLAYRSLPLDTLELLGWGQEWQWGYYKHPPLGAWLGEAMLRVFGGWLPSLYLLAQCCVLLCGWYVWRLARLYVDPVRAAVAVLLLEGAYAYTWLTPNFNMNLLQLPVWAGFCYHFVRALSGCSRHWFWVGVWAAACMLTKYSGVLLLASALCVMLVEPRARRAWRDPWLYVGALVALVLLTPHLLWLLDHWRLPLDYLRSFDAGPAPVSAHILEPIRFVTASLAGLTLTLPMAVSLWQRDAPRPRPLLPAAWLLILLFGPLVLSFLYGMFSGSRMKSTWAYPFFNLAGLWLCVVLPLSFTAARLRRMAVVLALTATAVGGLHLAYKLGTDKSKTGFDGARLAHEVASCWLGASPDAPLRIVAGDHILTAYVSAYARPRPSMWVNADREISPWITADRLRDEGAARVCRADTTCAEHSGLAWTHACDIEVDDQVFRVSTLMVDAPPVAAPPAPVSGSSPSQR